LSHHIALLFQELARIRMRTVPHCEL
jgi:hypothetical protein